MTKGIEQLIGVVWKKTLQDKIKAFVDIHNISEEEVIWTIDALRASFNQRDDISPGVSVKAVEIPITSIKRTPAHGTDADALYGRTSFNQQKADEATWDIELKLPVSEIQFISIDVDKNKLLVNGVDFIQKTATTIVFYKDPIRLGFNTKVKVENNEPITHIEMFLIGAYDSTIGSYLDRYSFYSIPKEVKDVVFSMIVEEASENKLVQGLLRLCKAKGPSIFDREDETGKYTMVARLWRDPYTLYAITSAKELIWAPIATEPFFTHASKIYAGESIIGSLEYSDRLSNTNIPGIQIFPRDTEGVVILNTEEALGDVEDTFPSNPEGYKPFYNLQIRGKREDRDKYYSNLEQQLSKYGIVASDVFDDEGKPTEQLYDNLGRPQPAGISISAEYIYNIGEFFSAYIDNTLAGLHAVFNISVDMDDTALLSYDEEVEVFLAYIQEEDFNISIEEGDLTGRIEI